MVTVKAVVQLATLKGNVRICFIKMLRSEMELKEKKIMEKIILTNRK